MPEDKNETARRMSEPKLQGNSLGYEPWLMEEYRLLSQHYFHEDGQIQKTNAIFATLDGGLLAFIGSSYSIPNLASSLVIPLMGILLSLAWFGTLVRMRECRNYAERRIATIEENLHTCWEGRNPLPLDIRTRQNWSKWRPRIRWFNLPYLLFRKVPTSLIYLLLPGAILALWILLLISGVSGMRV